MEDQPGQQWITLRAKSAEDENIKIEATMFDGSILEPKSDDEDTEEVVRLHISMLVDIWKGKETDSMEFVCSAWPDSLEIQKVYMFKRDNSPAQPYMGPDMKYGICCFHLCPRISFPQITFQLVAARYCYIVIGWIYVTKFSLFTCYLQEFEL